MKNLFKKNYLDSIFLIFLGAITTISLPPYNYFIINFITFTIFFVFIFNKRKASINNFLFFKYGWFFGFGYFSFSLYWISISLTFDENFKFLLPFAIILIPSFLAIFYGLVLYFFSIFFSKKLILAFLIFSVLFGTVEFIRGYIFTGFPWNLIAFSFSESENFIQIISVIGTYSFNLLCISFFTSPAILILKKQKKEILVFFFFTFIFAIFIAFGIMQNKQFDLIKDNKHEYIIRVVSPNISLNRFYLKDKELNIINEMILLSDPQKDKETIFLWPEGIISDTYLDNVKIYQKLFKKSFSKNHVVIFGINSLQVVDNKKKYFNSMAVFDNQLNLLNAYNKINLVPFGEFLPFESILGKLGLKTITNNYQSFSKGVDRESINIKLNNLNLSILPLICYELIYSGEIFKDQEFDFIVNISEDGWFGNSIGPKQHFTHSIFRSIESGKYIIRSANNGISAIINPLGRIEKQVKFGNTGYIDFNKSKIINKTIFSKFGNKIFIILILLYIFLIFSFRKLNNE